MLGAVEVGSWYCDLPFDELIWSDKVKEHFWLPPSARVTIDLFYERLHPLDRETVRAAIERSIADHTPYDIEYRTLCPPDGPRPGDIRWVRAIGYTAYDATGKPMRFDGITVDVTAPKRDCRDARPGRARGGAARRHARAHRRHARRRVRHEPHRADGHRRGDASSPARSSARSSTMC